jgi:outer membrane phospholipase A
VTRAVLAAVLAAALALQARAALAQDWAMVSKTGRAAAGQPFEVTVIAPPGQTLPTELEARMKVDVAEITLTLKAAGPPQDARRPYAAPMPASASGPVSLQLAEYPSNVLVLTVVRSGDALQTLTGPGAGGREPPLSENDPMYFVMGTRGGTSARFQLSFKYRLFDVDAGYGHEQPWLSGLYLGYTQNSLWDLEGESKAFRDTSYQPSLFWKWERAGELADRQFDGGRVGLEHESNGGEGATSRSINIAFVRPEWRWKVDQVGVFAFTPKIYAYLDKEENTDIDDYRGYVDWRARYDSPGGTWVATTVLRYGTAGKGSLLLDASRRIRDVKFGPVSTYLHVQFFAGYGESILDYNVKRQSQFRIGFAIVP